MYNTHHTPKDCHEAPSWLRGGQPTRFTRYGSTIRFFWFSDSRPSDTLGFDRATVWMRPEGLSHPVWVEMITGRVFEIPASSVAYKDGHTVLSGLPVWDSPVMVADPEAVPLRTPEAQKH